MTMPTATTSTRDEPVPLAQRVLALGVDASGVVTWCSPAFEHLLGYSADELVGRVVPQWLFEEDEVTRRAETVGNPFWLELFRMDPRTFNRRQIRVELGTLDRRERRGGPAGETDRDPTVPADWTMIAKDGRRVVVSVTVRPLPDGDGINAGYMAIGVDVTEERRTRRLLAQALEREQEATRRLEALDRLRNEFVTTAGHELRTPLTSILGYLELMDQQADESPGLRPLLQAVRRNAERIRNLADELLTLASADREIEQPMEVLDLREVVLGAGEVVRSMRAADSLVPTTSVPDSPVLVCGDRVQLERVVVHLVDNAVKFTGAHGEVACRLEVVGDDAVLEVADTGIGVRAEENHMIFERFYRGSDAVEAATPGAGIGLSIVRALVQRHGGSVALRPNHPRGSVFAVRLPRRT